MANSPNTLTLSRRNLLCAAPAAVAAAALPATALALPPVDLTRFIAAVADLERCGYRLIADFEDGRFEGWSTAYPDGPHPRLDEARKLDCWRIRNDFCDPDADPAKVQAALQWLVRTGRFVNFDGGLA